MDLEKAGYTVNWQKTRKRGEGLTAILLKEEKKKIIIVNRCMFIMMLYVFASSLSCVVIEVYSWRSAIIAPGLD